MFFLYGEVCAYDLDPQVEFLAFKVMLGIIANATSAMSRQSFAQAQLRSPSMQVISCAQPWAPPGFEGAWARI